MTFVPDRALLRKYADIFVHFALNDGKSIEPWSVVYVMLPECAKPFYLPLQASILEAWAFPIFNYIADGVARHFLDSLPNNLVEFYPKEYMLARTEAIDYSIAIIAEADKHEMDWVDTKKMFQRQRAWKFYRDALSKKEDEGKFTWTLWLYGTQAMADEVGMSLEEYWNQIIQACYLDTPDTVAEWKNIDTALISIKEHLNSLDIQSIHMVWDDCDLTIQLGSDRKWLWGSGRNIPSFELFISPDWRGTQGWIRFNQPLYRYGTLIEWIELAFENWLVTKASAKTNESVLLDMIAQDNANKVGEYSLTDSRLSRITKFMGETLYDENVWWPYWNSHIALWKAYKDSYPWDLSTVTEAQWDAMGYNDSVIHTDMISTTNRTVTATTISGEEVVIYKDGHFTFWNP